MSLKHLTVILINTKYSGRNIAIIYGYQTHNTNQQNRYKKLIITIKMTTTIASSTLHQRILGAK